jgi:hypothetical protein
MSERTPQVGDRVFHFLFGINTITEIQDSKVITAEYQFLTDKLELHYNFDDLWMYEEDYSYFSNPMRSRMTDYILRILNRVAEFPVSGAVFTREFKKLYNPNTPFHNMSDGDFLVAYNRIVRQSYKQWG